MKLGVGADHYAAENRKVILYGRIPTSALPR